MAVLSSFKQGATGIGPSLQRSMHCKLGYSRNPSEIGLRSDRVASLIVSNWHDFPLNPLMPANTRAELQRLLQARNEHPDREAEIDQQICTTFEQNCAILVLDLSGFSRLTIRHGIIHFLSMVHRMTVIATPIVLAHQGRVVKQEADNLFAAFAEVSAAVDAAIAILQAFTAVNTGLPDDKDLFASVGIGYGKTLVIADEDLYGSEMNLASKLGEDLARSGEILLTEAAFRALSTSSNTWERLTLSISGLEITTYQYSGSLLP